MGAQFGDAAVLHHRHAVGVVGGAEAVRDRHDGPAVQDGGERPCEAEPLLLASGELASGLGDTPLPDDASDARLLPSREG